jgi:hypothetical protein
MTVVVLSSTTATAAPGSQSVGATTDVLPAPTGPNGGPVPDVSHAASLQTVSSVPGGGVSPDTGSCWTSGDSPLQNYPVNTQENLCMVNDHGFVCNFSVEYGNVFSVAFAKLMLDSGSCDTSSSLSDNQVTAFYVHSGSESSSTSFGPYGFSSWVQAAGPAASSIFVGEWVVCMQIVVGTPADGDECLILTSSPF